MVIRNLHFVRAVGLLEGGLCSKWAKGSLAGSLVRKYHLGRD
jgi:hypothetical protein